MSTYDAAFRPLQRLNPAAPPICAPRGDVGRIGLAAAGLPPLLLVVDDHDDSRLIARLVLESVGFRVAEARTGFEGFRMAVALRPALVLLDLVLPGIDGWEVARLLRANSDCRHTSIVAVTAVASTEEQDRAILAGCDEVLTKPVRPANMLATVRAYVKIPLSSDRAS